MKYAVIRIKGKQHKVEENDEILIDRLVREEKLEPEVLLYVDDSNVEVGKPRLLDSKIGLKVLGEEKGKKIHVQTYKAKSRYRRKIGFRPYYSKIKIDKISIK